MKRLQRWIDVLAALAVSPVVGCGGAPPEPPQDPPEFSLASEPFITGEGHVYAEAVMGRTEAREQYNEEIAAWAGRQLRERSEAVKSTCSTQERATLLITIGPDLVVLDAALNKPSANAEFDRILAEIGPALVGEKMPSPPPDYPEMAPKRIHLNFENSVICDEDGKK